MSTRSTTVYVVVCDNCGINQATTEGNPISAVEIMTSLWGWAEADGKHTCARCLKRAREDACGARAGGHPWEIWDNGQPHSPWTKRRSPDGEPAFRMRICSECNYAEHQAEGGDWVSYRDLGDA